MALVAAVASAAPADAGVIVFSSDRCSDTPPAACERSLWTVQDDGSELTRVTAPPPGQGWADFNPDWSADGRSVLFQRHEGGTTRSLWIRSLETGVMAQVGPAVPNERFDAYNDVDWSPDGRTIVFATRAPDERFVEGQGFSSIWTMSIDGTAVTRLSDLRRGDTSPRFSPDGRRIAFAREHGDDGQPAVLTMNLDGTGVAPLIVGAPADAGSGPPLGNYRVAWSPDGSRFALAYRERLYTLSRDGRLRTRGTSGLPTDIGSLFSQLEWSSEPNDALVFSLPMQGRPLQRLNLTGPPQPPAELTSPLPAPPAPRHAVGDQDPRWRPDRPLPAGPDVDPPVVLPVGAGPVPASRTRAAIRVRRQRLSFLAADTAGVRRVDAAIARRVRPRGALRCRFAGRRGLGRTRRCARPLWRGVRGVSDLRRLARRVPPGAYIIRLRASDALGNRTRHPMAVPLRLRR